MILTAENISVADPEIKAAAKWWADQLRAAPKHDNGESLGSAFASMAAASLAALDPDTIDAFELGLVESLRLLLFGATWKADDPNRGRYMRTVATDYGPDIVLGRACDWAKVDRPSLRLPIKTVMWINPGSVSVACGYGAPDVVIYPVKGACQP